MSKVDVVVVGSGAAGSVMALELARRGLKVVVLEQGPREMLEAFQDDALATLARVYKEGGLQMTNDHNVVIAQGSAVGGSTVINNGVWRRADLDRVIPDWQRAGAPVPRDPLVKAYEEIEQGLQSELSMLATYLAWAEGRGVQVLDRCQDVRIATRQATATGVTCSRKGEALNFEADRVVVCAGAIGSSTVLLESGVSLEGRVGQGLHLLGGVFVTAEMKEMVDRPDPPGLIPGPGLAEDVVVERHFAPPAMFSISLGGWFLSHFRRMQRYRYFAQAAVMVGTDPTGRVWRDGRGRVHIDVAFAPRDLDRLRGGVRSLASTWMAAGAVRVLPATFKSIELVNPSDIDLVDELIRQPEDLLLTSAYPQGGNGMSEDPRQGVVGLDFRVHGFDNLYVADASVFPTNVWAPCQATVMAMAHYAASFVGR